MTILVVGATGTLGRQIVRELLNNGFIVNCLVRNIRKADFLREWGAQLVYADLKLPETIPNALKGISVVIDASTFRADDELAKLEEIDLVGKIALIKASKVANIKQFFFFSIKGSENFENIPILNLKNKVELILKDSLIPFTIFKISAFYQGLILQYAIPVLERQTIFTSPDSNLNSYINTQDVAKICTKFLLFLDNSSVKKNYIIELNGPKSWSSKSVINLVEQLAGVEAKLTFIPVFILKIVKNLMSFSKWTWEIHDRLTFSESFLDSSLSSAFDNKKIDSKISDIVFLKTDMLSLDDYLEEYFANMLKKLKDLNYDQNQAAKRKKLIF